MRFMLSLLLVLLLVACAKETAIPESTVTILPPAQDVPRETVPVDTAPVTPQDDNATPLNTTIERHFSGAISTIMCDPATRKLTFTINNPTKLTWNLDRDLPWPTPKGMTVVALSMNSLDINVRPQRTFNDEVMYGPKSPFSENCDGEPLLAPGEATTCTIYPVPLRTTEGIDARTNELALSAVGVYVVETFRC